MKLKTLSTKSETNSKFECSNDQNEGRAEGGFALIIDSVEGGSAIFMIDYLTGGGVCVELVGFRLWPAVGGLRRDKQAGSGAGRAGGLRVMLRAR